MAAKRRARRKVAKKKKPGVPKAVLNRTRVMLGETMAAKKDLDLRLQKLTVFLRHLLSHIHHHT